MGKAKAEFFYPRNISEAIHDAVVVYAAANGAAACPKGSRDWGVNADPPSAVTATGANPTSVADATGAWAAVACLGIADVTMLYAVRANNAIASADVCLK